MRHFFFVALFCATAFGSLLPKTVNILDVAIVGGGVSGLYAGYRLINAPSSSSKKIALFEISHRLGGRIWSVKIPGSDHLVADIGAMRFLTSQKNVYGLVKDELKLDTYDFFSNNNLEYFRDHHFLYSDYQNKANFPKKIPYFLRADETGQNPSQLIDKVYHQLFPELTSVTDPQRVKAVLRRETDLKGQPLYAWNSRNLLGQYLSNDAMRLLYDGIGFKPEFDEANGYEFFGDIAVVTDVKYLTVRDGTGCRYHQARPWATTAASTKQNRLCQKVDSGDATACYSAAKSAPPNIQRPVVSKEFELGIT